MKTKTMLLFTCIAFIWSCNNGDVQQPLKEQVVRELTPEELKAELKQKECDNATEYLHGKLSYEQIYKGLLSLKVNGIKLTCNITNSATTAIFKNMIAHVSFLSKTNAVVIEKDISIYEFIKPNGTITYKGEIECTNQNWKDIADVSWSFKSAECE